MNQSTKLRIRSKAIQLIPWLGDLLDELRFRHEVAQLREKGFVLPLPGFLKRAIIKAEAARIGAVNFVETGTYHGGTVWSLRNDFAHIVSIEVEPLLAKTAQIRFSRFPHIQILHGDSSLLLSKVVKCLRGPTVCWLDGHYSGGETGMGVLECPLEGELRAVCNCKEKLDVSILIDDARLFGSAKDYPALDEVTSLLNNTFPRHTIKIENDIIHARLQQRRQL